MNSLIKNFYERGFIDQIVHEKELNEYLDDGDVTCYIGFDPTASSLHVGNLVPVMALAHMQRAGFRPVALIGGGTGLVGDPSGKTETRKLLTSERIRENSSGIKEQLSRFIEFRDGKALLVDNSDWLNDLRYIDFLRDVGRCFSVNRMIKAETYKMRLDSDDGLSFIEFNYMLLQAYDFLKLFNGIGCRLQMGGSDQWGNIVAGINLIRRIKGEMGFGITFPLITSSSGAKMGKTAKGAVWLDKERTTPYEYYQYWVNSDDKDVLRFLLLFTFLPVDEIRKIEKLEGSDLNKAKIILAYEATLLVHGRENAGKAYHAAISMFGAQKINKNVLPSSTIPRCESDYDDMAVPHSYIEIDELKIGVPAFKMFHLVGLAKSKGASRRLIDQGGAYINARRVESFDYLITDGDLNNMEILLRSGKKRFHKIKIKK